MSDPEKYFCIYCQENHEKHKFAENYPQCYYKKYGEEPPSVNYEEYMNRLEQIGIV